MSEQNFRILIPAVIALLIIWLIYRIKNSIKTAIKNEIYSNFPSIKDTVNNFQLRIDYLKTQLEALECKIKELQEKTK
jgi:peptidoglycan hydrolase CwlO-like protein